MIVVPRNWACSEGSYSELLKLSISGFKIKPENKDTEEGGNMKN